MALKTLPLQGILTERVIREGSQSPTLRVCVNGRWNGERDTLGKVEKLLGNKKYWRAMIGHDVKRM